MYDIDVEYANDVFESIIENKKKYRAILFKVIEFLYEHDEEQKPQFKYQRPDAWYPPPTN